MFDYRLGYIREGCALPGIDEWGKGEDSILLLGGYTTPEQAASGHTWTRRLAQQVGAGTRIWSGCTDGYSSAQMLVLFLREAILLRPRLVICLGGFYDVAYRLGLVENREQAAFLRTHPFATPRQMDFLGAITARFGMGGDKVYYGEECTLPAHELWRGHMADMHCLCEEFGMEFRALLQPSVFSGRYQPGERERALLRERYCLTEAELEEMDGRFRQEYAAMSRLAGELDYITDLSGVFDDCTEVYEDACHVGEAYLERMVAGI